MYRDFFKLDDYPFRLTADARYFFMGDGHSRATAYLKYLFHVRDGIGVITGDPGVGKSVVLEHVLAELHEGVALARIQQTQLTASEFLLAVCLKFGLRPDTVNKAKLTEELYRFCRKTHFSGKFVLLVIDEAQRLKPQVLEEIRMLANMEKNGRKLMHVVLSGQPELNLLLSPKYKDALSQQIRLSCHIEPLKQEEVSRYIEYRLWIAGGEHTVDFPAELLPLIMRFTGGIPRLINVLCDMTLIAACISNNRYVDEKAMQAAIRKLEWPPYLERTGNLPKEYLLPRPGPARNQNQPRLSVHNHGDVIAEYNLEKERLQIGRGTTQDIQLKGRKTSRHHAQIVNINGKYYLQDLNSTNGTFINKKMVTWHSLSNGDHFQIDDYLLIYHENDNPQLGNMPEDKESLSKTKN